MPPWVPLLLACEPPTEGPPPPSTETGCAASAWYADGDGDGHGDPARETLACEPPASAVALGDDCDDTDREVFPGAPERCGGADDDCDGALGPDELDGDGDGYAACAGDCDDGDEAVSPAAEERCGGADEDCDGLVDLDDDSVDLYSCGYCPDASQVPTWTFQTRTLNPCVLDPTVSMCSRLPGFPDTHDRGNRLHRVIWRDDGHPLRDQLLLYLPPGPGDHNNRVLAWAAYAGYRTISLGWQNEALVDHCPDSQCFDDVHWELIYGDDRSPYLDVWPSDSIMGRLDTLFAYLVATYPDEGWDAYWDPASGTRWDRVVVEGWSVGCAEAAYLGRFHQTAGQILVSGPMDLTADNQPAAWMAEPRATEDCRQWGLYHRMEPGTGYDTGGPDLFPVTLGMLGLPGPAVDVDTLPAPYDGARILNTAKTDYTAEWCNPHQAMAMDECIHADLSQVYTYAYCAAGSPQACP